VALEKILERSRAAAVAAGHDRVAAASGCLKGTACHFMRYCICKQDDEIGAADLIAEITPHFCEYLSFAAVFFTYIFVLAFHAFVSAYDYDAHNASLLSYG